jgi:transcriptional repressor NrdR
LNCPYCGDSETKVIDTRPADEGASIRRRRECTQCRNRFTTYEKIEEVPLVVVKKDTTRESFNRNKLLGGIIRACEKRPVSMEQIEHLVDWIEKKLQNTLDREVSSQAIGELVMLKLKELDEVAYVRFASVYRQFKDINTFVDELTKLLNEKKRPGQ